jgi:hypothetical protein
MRTTMTDDRERELIQRLRAKKESDFPRHGSGWADAAGNGGFTIDPPIMVPVNPDGAQAAEVIESLLKCVEETRAFAKQAVDASVVWMDRVEEARAKALREAQAIAQAKYDLCQKNVCECRDWSPAQAEWSRARDACGDIADNILALIAAEPGRAEG